MSRSGALVIALLLAAPALAGCLDAMERTAREAPARLHDGVARPTLLAHWSFDTTSVGLGAALPEGALVPGRAGDAYDLRAGALSATLPTGPDSDPGATLSFWVLPEPAADPTVLATVHAEGCPSLQVTATPEGALSADLPSGCALSFNATLEAGTLQAGAWTHIIVDWDLSNVVLRIDGRIALKGPVHPGTPPEEPERYLLTVGSDGAAGVVDEVRLYSGPLDPATLDEVVRVGGPADGPPDLHAWWPLDSQHHDRPEPGRSEERWRGLHARIHGATLVREGSRYGYLLGPGRNLTLPLPLAQFPPNGTLSLWAFVHPASSWDADAHILPLIGASAGCNVFLLYTTPGPGPFWTWGAWTDTCSKHGAPATKLRSGDDVATGRWTHFALVWTPEGSALYIDGVAQEADRSHQGRWEPPAPSVSAPGLLTLGSPFVANATALPAVVTDLRLYARSLPAAEVATLAVRQ